MNAQSLKESKSEHIHPNIYPGPFQPTPSQHRKIQSQISLCVLQL